MKEVEEVVGVDVVAAALEMVDGDVVVAVVEVIVEVVSMVIG